MNKKVNRNETTKNTSSAKNNRGNFLLMRVKASRRGCYGDEIEKLELGATPRDEEASIEN